MKLLIKTKRESIPLFFERIPYLGPSVTATISRPRAHVDLFYVAGLCAGTHPHGSGNSRSVSETPHVDSVHV